MSIATEKNVVVDYKLTKQFEGISFLQYDTNLIKFTIEDNGEIADLSNITKIVVNFRRPDRKVISQTLTAIGNEITYRLTDSEMITPGECELVLQLYDDVERLSIAKFKVKIEENIESGEAPTVEEVRLITQLINTVNEKLEELSEGAQGQKGDKGDTGERGIQGERGLQGIQGIQGVKGDTGAPGAKGDKGDKGDVGNAASVTSGNIVAALGYTPIKASDITWSSVSSKPTTFAPSTHTHPWADITGTPTTFTPSIHTHSYNDLTNKPTIPTLNNTVTSTSTTQAATANAVKLAYDRAEAAFRSASDGKTLISNAITGKGGTATSGDTFAQLSTAITNLPMGKRLASGTFTAARVVSDTTIGFSPSVVIVRGKYVDIDIYVLSTYVNTTIDTTPANILNSYTLSASSTLTLHESEMVITDDGFTLNITEIGEYSGMWIAYE